jgi:hypothetical protein
MYIYSNKKKKNLFRLHHDPNLKGKRTNKKVLGKKKILVKEINKKKIIKKNHTAASIRKPKRCFFSF